MSPHPRALLIGGTSHTGKSRVADHLAMRLGGVRVSTDGLARHPGRPWASKDKTVPAHVVDHYRRGVEGELIASVLAHYRTLWPRIQSLVHDHFESRTEVSLILEGLAILPREDPKLGKSLAVWLTSNENLLKERIWIESRYVDTDPDGKILIDAFVGRTLEFNRLIRDEVARLDAPLVSIEKDMTVEEVAALCLHRARPSDGKPLAL